MSIGGYSNNFNPTIDGLNNFVLDDVTCNTLVVNNTITLPNNSILDNYLTTNIPKKNANNNFTGDNDYSGLITFQNGGIYKCNIFANGNLFSFTNNNIGGTIEFFCNTLITAVLVSPLSLSYTGLICDSITQNINKVITQSGSTGSNIFKGFSVLANQSITQSGSGILSQSGTGVNLLKAITIQVDNNLLQSGTGIVSQSGTGINALKSCDITGNISIKSANSLFLYNTANTISTKIFQSGATLKFTNTSQPSQYTFEAYDAFGNLYTYTIGSSFTSGGDVILSNNTSLRLKDTSISTTNLTQSGGNCNIQNTKQSGSIKLTTQDATTNTRDVVIAYTGVSIPSLLTCNNGFTLSSGTLTLPANSISDSALSSSIVKLSTANTFTNTNTFQSSITLQSNTNLPTSTFTTPTSNQLGYTLVGTKTTTGVPFTYTTPSSVFTLATISLPYGVWNVIGQLAYYVNTAGTMPLLIQYSISKFPSVSLGNIDEQVWDTEQKFNITTGYTYPKRMNTIITSTTSSTNVYLNLRLDFLVSGNYQITTTSQTDNVNFYAVRIA